MAYIWHMSVLLHGAVAAAEFSSSFPVDPVTVAGKPVRFAALARVDECNVYPECDAMMWLRAGGPGTPDEIMEADELARVLYGRLAGMSGYSAAIVGTEVSEWLEREHVMDLLARQEVPGLVFVPGWVPIMVDGMDRFSREHVWYPYRGGRT